MTTIFIPVSGIDGWYGLNVKNGELIRKVFGTDTFVKEVSNVIVLTEAEFNDFTRHCVECGMLGATPNNIQRCVDDIIKHKLNNNT